MASSSSEPLFIGSNSSSDDLFKLLKGENNLFKDLIPNNKNNILFLLSSTLSSSFSSEYPAKRRKLRAINT